MKYAVLYHSHTGNTEAVAKAIAGALPEGQSRLEAITSETAVPEEDFVFAGFWTDKGTASPVVAQLLSRFHGKKVAFFGTAGMGGSQPYFQGIVERASQVLPGDNEKADWFFCQGKMPAPIRARYEAALEKDPNDQRMRFALENFDRALSHPDPKDLEDAAAFARRVIRE